jgi:hypothetical protein
MSLPFSFSDEKNIVDIQLDESFTEDHFKGLWKLLPDLIYNEYIKFLEKNPDYKANKNWIPYLGCKFFRRKCHDYEKSNNFDKIKVQKIKTEVNVTYEMVTQNELFVKQLPSRKVLKKFKVKGSRRVAHIDRNKVKSLEDLCREELELLATTEYRLCEEIEKQVQYKEVDTMTLPVDIFFDDEFDDIIDDLPVNTRKTDLRIAEDITVNQNKKKLQEIKLNMKKITDKLGRINENVFQEYYHKSYQDYKKEVQDIFENLTNIGGKISNNTIEQSKLEEMNEMLKKEIIFLKDEVQKAKEIKDSIRSKCICEPIVKPIHRYEDLNINNLCDLCHINYNKYKNLREKFECLKLEKMSSQIK